MLKSATVAAVAAAAVLLAITWPREALAEGRLRIGFLLSVALGFYVGCWMLGLAVTSPTLAHDRAQDLDRLLFVLLPLAFVAELLAALPAEAGSWAGQPALVVVAATPILLDHSSYVTDLAGPDTREWSTLTTTLVFAVAALTLAAAWTILVNQSARSQGTAVLVVLAVTAAATTLVVMLSGYASGGQLGVPLAGALGGCAGLVATAGSRGAERCSGLWRGRPVCDRRRRPLLRLADHDQCGPTAVGSNVLLAADPARALPSNRPDRVGIGRSADRSDSCRADLCSTIRRQPGGWQRGKHVRQEPSLQDYLDFGR